ncbi:MAG: transposase, partial [Nitrososphaerota archaeon]|nr:transposase [Nitrososphaerota archaeon]
MENIKYNKPSSDIKDVNFGDKRLNARLEVSVEAMTQRSQASILSGCGTKHGAKAFYALLSNDKFSMEEIGNKVYEATAER